MTREVRIYVEGGGDGGKGKAAIRRGFSAFLNEFHEAARTRKGGVTVIACGSRNSTFDDFRTGLATNPDAFNVLLVDSEGPVSGKAWDHLHTRDNWQRPSATDNQCHLMVQTMESWFIADRKALEEFYGQNFNVSAIPKHDDVEQVEKERVSSALKDASRQTKKGEYHKIRHGSKLLALIDPETVRRKARHCDRLLKTLGEKVGIAS